MYHLVTMHLFIDVTQNCREIRTENGYVHCAPSILPILWKMRTGSGLIDAMLVQIENKFPNAINTSDLVMSLAISHVPFFHYSNDPRLGVHFSIPTLKLHVQMAGKHVKFNVRDVVLWNWMRTACYYNMEIYFDDASGGIVRA